MKRLLTIALGLLVACFAGNFKSQACTRVVYTGDTTAVEGSGAQALRIVGRSLDWSTPIPTNIFVYPRGMEKVSNNKGKIIKWKSKYGAVYAVGYNAGVTEGMNEKGLSVNGLFCRGTIYNTPEVENNADIPAMSLAVIVEWMLDNCATTREVVDLVKSTEFKIVGATFDGGTVSTLHWGITDDEGKTAILEFQQGQMNIYETEVPVLTNDPAWPDMLAINHYWEGVGGANFLPGSVKSPDRFVRGYFFENSVERTNDSNTGLAVIRSILNNCSVPFKYSLGDKNLSQTQWRSFSNLRDRKYYFENVTDLGLYYVDLMECNLQPGASVLYFDTQDARNAIGNITGQMVESQPFTPMF
ncbi:MAG: linear amide C-N hydrolase [Clostridium sp.]|nr:linear amide C-N hydrolase [Clostridium sp.]